MSDAEQAIDRKLLPAFLVEADELLPRIDIGLRQIEQGLADVEALRRLQRSLHTLKGTARVTGALGLGETVHRIELQIKELVSGAMPTADLAALQTGYRLVAEGIAVLHALPGADAPDEAADRNPEASIESLLGRLQKAVDLAALDLGKQVHLECQDNDVYLPRERLAILAPALEHLLRNAVAHGIEPPERRRALGKSAAGVIELATAHNGTGVTVRVSDDGAGIDLVAVQARARALGMAVPANPIELIFASGLSTVSATNQTAGMGIGLDAVRATVAELGGRIEAESEPGRGVEFRILLPN